MYSKDKNNNMKKERLKISTKILNTLISNCREYEYSEYEIGNMVNTSIRFSDTLIKELGFDDSVDVDDSDTTMFDMYVKCKSESDRIMSLPFNNTTDLKNEITKSFVGVDDTLFLKFYEYLSIQFLNYALNRLTEFGTYCNLAEDRALESRIIISGLITEKTKNKNFK